MFNFWYDEIRTFEIESNKKCIIRFYAAYYNSILREWFGKQMNKITQLSQKPPSFLHAPKYINYNETSVLRTHETRDVQRIIKASNMKILKDNLCKNTTNQIFLFM